MVTMAVGSQTFMLPQLTLKYNNCSGGEHYKIQRVGLVKDRHHRHRFKRYNFYSPRFS